MENNISIENNIGKEQALHLIESWGNDFWKRIPSRCAKAVLELYSFSDAAAEFGLTPQAMCHCATDGRIPRPTVSFNTAKYYTAAEVRKIRQTLAEIKRPRGRPRKDAAEMRKKWLSGVSQAVIAAQHGVTQGTVSRMVRGER